MIVYITQYCSYAVSTVERSDGSSDYRVLAVEPMRGQDEWRFIKHFYSTREGYLRAVKYAEEMESLAE